MWSKSAQLGVSAPHDKRSHVYREWRVDRRDVPRSNQANTLATEAGELRKPTCGVLRLVTGGRNLDLGHLVVIPATPVRRGPTGIAPDEAFEA